MDLVKRSGCLVGQLDTGHISSTDQDSSGGEMADYIGSALSKGKGVTHLFDSLKVALSQNSMSKF